MAVILNNDKIIKGLNVVCDAVKETIGVEGGLAIIDNIQHVTVTKDGVSLTKEIHLEDVVENMGASLMKEAALKTLNEAGDGTSTTCVLAQAIIGKGKELIDSGVSHVEIREGILQAKNDILKKLKKYSRKTSVKDIYRVAKVAANGDEEIAKLIKKAYDSISLDGMIEVISTANKETTLEINDGLKIDKGYFSEHFITDTVKKTAVLTNVKILAVDGNIPEDFVKMLMPAIKECEKDNSSLFIICDEIHNTAVGSLIRNKLNNTLASCVIKNPFYGKGRLDLLQDIEAYTGAKILKAGISEEYKLGDAERIVINGDETLIQKNESSEFLEEYIESVKLQEDNAVNRKRLSNLSSNLATLFIGGNSPSEMSEKYDRAEDSVLAVKSALSSGVVAGGGSTFEFISKESFSNNVGYNVLLSSIRAPYEQILKNAAINNLPEISKYGEVYNVKTRKVEKMNLNGIIDSTKVLKTALESAVSIAILVLSTKVSITTEKNR